VRPEKEGKGGRDWTCPEDKCGLSLGLKESQIKIGTEREWRTSGDGRRRRREGGGDRKEGRVGGEVSPATSLT